MLLLVVTLLFAGCRHKGTEVSGNGSVELSREQFLETGEEWASSMELAPGDVQVSLDEENRGWSEYFTWLRQEDDPELIATADAIKTRLYNRDYQVVHIVAGPDIMGGPWWLFVDKHTGGKILAIEEIWRGNQEY